MRPIFICSFFLLTASLTVSTLHAQNTVPTMMQTSLSKIRASSEAGRVIERTFSDIIFRNDSVAANCVFFHRFSSSNNYRIDAFASSNDISSINVYVYYWDSNNKWQKVGSNTSTGTDVSFRFTPQTTASYAIMVRGALQTNINNALFNVIIERE